MIFRVSEFETKQNKAKQKEHDRVEEIQKEKNRYYMYINN